MDHSRRQSDGRSLENECAATPEAESRFTDGRLSHLVAHLQDAVVEFRMEDQIPIVIAVNRAFEETFGYTQADIRGESLNEHIVPDRFSSEASEFDQQTASGELNYAIVRRQTDAGVRSFLYRSIPYAAHEETWRGFAVYTDITEEVQRKRRLQVLHRLLRHNLRNDLSVISGYTELLEEEGTTGDVDEWVASIRDRVSHLEHLAREATLVQRILDSDLNTDEPINVSRICTASIAEHRRRFPDATISASIPDGIVARTTEHIRSVVGNVVENAIEHNTSQSPTVHLTVEQPTATSSWVEIHVEDDGPEIPAVVRETVTSQQDVTQLQHGEGLGLWLVRWIVARSGGEIALQDSDDLGGNRVVLRLPS